MPRYQLPPLPQGALFAPPQDLADAVLLGSAVPNWYSYAAGYKMAADLLSSRLRDRGVVTEHVCLPVLFLYRHYVELSLKALLLDLGELTDHVEPTSTRHPLQPLWKKFVDRARASGIAGADPWLDQIGAWILELDALDGKSFTFRYPVDIAGSPMLTGRIPVDMGHVRSVMGEISGIFQGAAEMVAQHLDIKRDLEEEFATEYYR
jgi:hypothetical protein